MTTSFANPSRFSNDQRYLPLDELLEMPRVRILRALRRFDWVSVEDINLALDNLDDRAANAHTKCVERLVREGHLEKRGTNWSNNRYRITDRGKQHLKDLLARGEVNEGPVIE